MEVVIAVITDTARHRRMENQNLNRKGHEETRRNTEGGSIPGIEMRKPFGILVEV